jgi:hypothetical protein
MSTIDHCLTAEESPDYTLCGDEYIAVAARAGCWAETGTACRLCRGCPKVLAETLPKATRMLG